MLHSFRLKIGLLSVALSGTLLPGGQIKLSVAWEAQRPSAPPTIGVV